MKQTPGVYLLHFEPSYKHAGHYIGYADDIGARVRDHAQGRGARLPQVAVSAGCLLVLARIWPGADRATERRLKRWHGGGYLCPICRGEAVQLPLFSGLPAYIPEPEAAEVDPWTL